MKSIEEMVLLAPHTTLGVGGPAHFFARCTIEEHVQEALIFAREKALGVAVLGGGSNTLVPDGECDGLVLKIATEGITFKDEGETVSVVAGAGVSWDALVRLVGERGLWGIENLAAIPGTVGGAVVQNIGAYGAELSSVFVSAECISRFSGNRSTVSFNDAAFAYRSSIFKEASDMVITHVTLRLMKNGLPELGYPDLKSALLRDEPLSTPREVAEAVRRIRSAKFPAHGSAGSFFKNPIVSKAVGDDLVRRFPGLPLYSLAHERVKVSLAWILDHVLSLKGFRRGAIGLYEKQPLVLVAYEGARARDIEIFANDIARQVYEATGLIIHREVETLSTKKNI